MKNILLEKAIEYANRGWYVFPCREKESRPFLNDKGKLITIPVKAPYVKHGFKVATTNIETIRGWWKKYPNAAIGVSCGQSNLVVLDIDVRDGKRGFDSFASLNLSDEGALHSITASKGLHIVYSGKVNSHANVKTGVDVRSEGAYFIVPPSWIFEDNQKKFYTEADDWNRTPVLLPSDFEEKINLLYGKEKKQNTTKKYPVENFDKTLFRVKKALDSIPSWMADDYFSWVNVGLALKTLGEEGFSLWDNWSRKSSKYDYDALCDRWEKFEPNSITIATIFHYAKTAPKEIKV